MLIKGINVRMNCQNCLQEADYPGKQLVFGKDTFLIRNPYRAFPPHKKVFAGWMDGFLGTKEFRLCDMPPAWMLKNYGVQEQYELMTYLQEHASDPIIVDADDLLKNPASVLRQFCALLGIPFSEERLEWPAGLRMSSRPGKEHVNFLLVISMGLVVIMIQY